MHLYFCYTHTHTHVRAHTHTHVRARTHTHTHTTLSLSLSLSLCTSSADVCWQKHLLTSQTKASCLNVNKPGELAWNIWGWLNSGNACHHFDWNPLYYLSLHTNTQTKTYRTIILPAVLNGPDPVLLHKREERRQSVFQMMVLKDTFMVTTEEVTWDCRKGHDAQLLGSYCSTKYYLSEKSRKMRWGGHVAHRGRENIHTGFGKET